MIHITKIVSGGQTGADRAALDWAIANSIPHGGWCPKGRIAEDGVIPERYHLQEMPVEGYLARTEANVRDSEGTLILSLNPTLSGGSKNTAKFSARLGKPWLHLHPAMDWKTALTGWLNTHQIQTLNVAGPRESKEPNVAALVKVVLDYALNGEKLEGAP